MTPRPRHRALPPAPAGLRRLLPRLRAGAAAGARRHLPGLWSRLNRRLPASAMLTAQELALAGDHDAAIAHARRHLPADCAGALHVLQANRAIAAGDEGEWLVQMNLYLAPGGTAPLRLGTGSGLLGRLTTLPPPPAGGGPLVSVLMPARNAEATLAAAARSILRQSWGNLELLIVDDASEDGTWAVCLALAGADARVRIRRNPRAAGPYVARNLALAMARGAWITGHDADDWAHPERLARHMAAAAGRRASVTHMLRLAPDGRVTRLSRRGGNSPDGAAQLCYVSCLFEAGFLRDTLGGWDCVRFGADSEIISRARAVIGDEFAVLPQIGMLCLDLPGGLTSGAGRGLSAQAGLSPPRAAYRAAFRAWHETLATAPAAARLAFPPAGRRPFTAPEEMVVPQDAIRAAVEG